MKYIQNLELKLVIDMNQSQHDSEKSSAVFSFMTFEKRSLTQKNNSKQTGYEKSLLYKNLTFSFILRLLKSEILNIFHKIFLLCYFLSELIVIVGYMTWNVKHKTWNFRFVRHTWQSYSVTSCTIPLISILSQFIGNFPLFFFEIAWL